MKTLVTIGLILGLVLAPLPVQQTHAQTMPASCVVAVLAVAIGGVMIYGLVKMCQAIPADDNPPQDTPPGLNLPPGPPMYIFRVPPKLAFGRAWMQEAIVSVEHQDGPSHTRAAPWVTDYSFKWVPGPSGCMSIVAFDANGAPLLTNTVQIVSASGQNWAVFDFTTLPPSVTDQPSTRFFRLSGQ